MAQIHWKRYLPSPWTSNFTSLLRESYHEIICTFIQFNPSLLIPSSLSGVQSVCSCAQHCDCACAPDVEEEEMAAGSLFVLSPLFSKLNSFKYTCIQKGQGSSCPCHGKTMEAGRGVELVLFWEAIAPGIHCVSIPRASRGREPFQENGMS